MIVSESCQYTPDTPVRQKWLEGLLDTALAILAQTWDHKSNLKQQYDSNSWLNIKNGPMASVRKLGAADLVDYLSYQPLMNVWCILIPTNILLFANCDNLNMSSNLWFKYVTLGTEIARNWENGAHNQQKKKKMSCKLPMNSERWINKSNTWICWKI